ncbi:hypothetical protein ACTJKN_26240 [Pedobacter sp. 22163]|uniref:hypothetical protein n=1 Tax=Pedobacter sp. 22163 TaxID=3453883 RepID=UPI003F875BE0
MDEFEKKGRNDILRSLASMLLFSIYVLVTYHVALGYIDKSKLVVQVIRLVLTGLMLYLVFKGYSWARNLFTVLTALSMLILIPAIFNDSAIENKIPLFTGLIIYSLALYRVNFLASAKAYFEYIKANR